MMIFYQSIIVFLFGFWIYSLFTCIEDKFKKNDIKSYWLIAHILIPLTGFLYFFFRNDLIKRT